MNLSKEEIKAAFKEAVREDLKELRKTAAFFLLDWFIKAAFTVSAAFVIYMFLKMKTGSFENVGKIEDYRRESPPIASER
jgi:hypothetical protein